MSESIHQQELMKWLRLRKIWAFHVPNERQSKVQHLVKLKAEGVRAGVPDNIIISAPEHGFSPKAFGMLAKQLPLTTKIVYPRGVALELKDDHRKPTNEQLAWLEIFRRHGWLADWKIGHVAAIEWLVDLGYGL